MKVILWPLFSGGYLATLDNDGSGSGNGFGHGYGSGYGDGYSAGYGGSDGYGSGDYFDDVLKTNRR